MITVAGCAGSPSTQNGIGSAYRPAFLVGDQVSVIGGDYAQLVGTVEEIDLEADVYRVRFADRPNQVYINSGLLRKYYGGALKPVPAVSDGYSARQTQGSSLVKTNGVYGRLAVLPVIGLEEYVAETLAWHLANENNIHSSFNVVPITPQIRKNVMSEETYSAIYNAGEDVNADYILTSFARHVGTQKMFLTMVIDVRTKEQVAGDYKKYDDIEDIPLFFPAMTKKIMTIIAHKNTSAPKLSVELMAAPPNNTAYKNNAAVLTQLLAISMANTNRYAVYPRTDHIDAAMLDYETRRTTARHVFVNTDDITPARFVMSGKLDSFDSRNQVLVEIVDINGNVLHKGAYVNFNIIEDVPDLFGRLSANVGTPRTGTDAQSERIPGASFDNRK